MARRKRNKTSAAKGRKKEIFGKQEKGSSLSNWPCNNLAVECRRLTRKEAVVKSFTQFDLSH